MILGESFGDVQQYFIRHFIRENLGAELFDQFVIVQADNNVVVADTRLDRLEADTRGYDDLRAQVTVQVSRCDDRDVIRSPEPRLDFIIQGVDRRGRRDQQVRSTMRIAVITLARAPDRRMYLNDVYVVIDVIVDFLLGD